MNGEIKEEGISSYAELKKKLIKTKEECEVLRKTLQETQKKQSDLGLEVELLRTQSFEAKWDKLRLELDDAMRQKKRGEAKLTEMRHAWQDMYVKQSDHALQVQQLRLQLEEGQVESDEFSKGLIDKNVVLTRQVGMLRLRLEESKTTIGVLSDAYDVMVKQVEAEKANAEKGDGNARIIKHGVRQMVCRAFDWSLETVDPSLLRAACGFWEGCSNRDLDGNGRVSCRSRKDIWLELTCVGFKGKVMDELNKAFRKENRFDVIELARRSDVNCQYNATAVGAVSQCQLGKKKYERGVLCSDATLRRTQKRVLQLATSLGFNSYPKEEEGKVWLWGDDHGEFVTGVNRYVYEVYVKARCPLVTKDQPWIVSLSGDLARVSTRGK